MIRQNKPGATQHLLEPHRIAAIRKQTIGLKQMNCKEIQTYLHFLKSGYNWKLKVQNRWLHIAICNEINLIVMKTFNGSFNNKKKTGFVPSYLILILMAINIFVINFNCSSNSNEIFLMVLKHLMASKNIKLWYVYIN